MVKLIVGEQGTGKTKDMIEMVNEAAVTSAGNVVCIESDMMMTYTIKPQVRLLCSKDYCINSYELFRGFICGLYAGNYDISHIFIDNLCKICCVGLSDDAARFLDWLSGFSIETGVDFIVTISADPANVPEALRKFL